MVRLTAGFLLVNALLLAPGWIAEGGVGPRWLALEALLLTGLFALVPSGGWSRLLRGTATGLLGVFLVLALADVAARLSLNRPLNLYLDAHLITAVYNLAVGTLGPIRAVLALAGLATGLLLVGWGLYRLWAPLDRPYRSTTVRTGAVALGVVVTAGLFLERVPGAESRVGWPASDLTREQIGYWNDMQGERERFGQALSSGHQSYRDIPNLLGKLDGRDVVLAFIESYGVSALNDDRYAPVIVPRLEEMEDRVRAAGLHMVSGVLVAPSQGGQSWFGHGTLLSGLWLNNQLRYDLFLASGRETLIDDFRHAGYRTAALFPAITMAWPEGERLGFDRIFAYDDIDYRGPPLNWVTMPDQFTWHYLEDRVRTRTDDRPVFATVGLISSHAPWTPILPVLDDWDGIEDGSVFRQWEDAGESPAELWQDTDRVREHYALAVDYALHAMTGYAERYVDERTLLIALGDHQPAPLITGDDAGLEVPVHVIAGERELLAPFLRWGFTEGALPEERPDALGMDYFRDWFVPAFSGAPVEAGSG